MKTNTELKRAMKGLTVDQGYAVVRAKDAAYDLARREGFDDTVATQFACAKAVKTAKSLKEHAE